MAEMSKTFPAGIKYASLYDTTVFVEQAIDAVYQTLFEAAILVLIVIMVFLQNFRAMLVPATTVPVTIIGAFAAMAALGFSINLMTLFALILAIGIVVDDAIVIVENASHYIEQGLTPKDAAIKAMSELTGPVIGITLVLTAVFVPAAFLPGITGQLFRQFALVIAATAVISAINAVTLKPAQCALYLRPKNQGQQANCFYRGFNRVYARSRDATSASSAGWRIASRLMVCVFFVVIGVAGWPFMRAPDRLPADRGPGLLHRRAKLPDGASQPRARAVVDKINAILEETRACGLGDDRRLLDPRRRTSRTPSTTFVVYKDWGERPPELSQARSSASSSEASARSGKRDDFVVLPPPPIPGLGNAGGFQMMVEDRGGVGLARARQGDAARSSSTRARPAGLPAVGFTTFSAGSPQLYLDIDRTKAKIARRHDRTTSSRRCRPIWARPTSTFNKFNQSFQVCVQAERRFRLQPEDIAQSLRAQQQGRWCRSARC